MEIASAPTEVAFTARRQRDWGELDEIVRVAERRGLKRLAPARIARLSPLYRDACADLAHAQAARYSAALVDYLQGLTAGAHTILYGGSADRPGARAGSARGSSLRVALEIFPRAVRRHKVAMLV